MGSCKSGCCQKTKKDPYIWIPPNQYCSEWETDPVLSIKSDNCISTRVEYVDILNHDDANESKSESEEHRIFVAVGTETLLNIGSTENDTAFTHIIEATVAVKVLKGDAKNAIIWLNDDDTFISLDCPKCKRVFRSVFFKNNGKANCTGSTGHGDYPGQIIKMEAFRTDNIVLATYTMVVTWEPFIDSKYTEQESTEIGESLYGRICFEIGCGICGKNISCISFQGNGHYNREYIKCDHIHCIEYNSTPSQPWINCKEIVINHKILQKLLQEVMSHTLSNELIAIIVDYASGYW